jgi:transcriptional regulator with XRE-family HTH domain
MKKNKELSQLCIAVKAVREVLGDSQERFARRVGVALMTISRFERGVLEPRDPRVLLNLAKVTDEIKKGTLFLLTAGTEKVMKVENASKLFNGAYKEYERLWETDETVAQLESLARLAPPAFLSVREWRLVCAARLALRYYPEYVGAIEKAAAPAIVLIDEILAGADENAISYQQFERAVFALAERQMLKDLKARERQEEK